MTEPTSTTSTTRPAGPSRFVALGVWASVVMSATALVVAIIAATSGPVPVNAPRSTGAMEVRIVGPVEVSGKVGVSGEVGVRNAKDGTYDGRPLRVTDR